MKKFWKKVDWKLIKKRKKDFFYESRLLQLNCSKANKKLNWRSVLSFNQTISMTINWYRKFYEDKKNIKKLSLSQIKFYEKLIRNRT